jgi:integrase
MAATIPIRSKQDIRRLVNYYTERGQLRNSLLIVVGLHTALRISDILSLRWEQFLTPDGTLNSHITLTERKTGKAKTIRLHAQILVTLKRYLAEFGGQPSGFIFSSPRKEGCPLVRSTAWRIIRAAVLALGLSGVIACHSLRKTFGYHARKAGTELAVLMEVFNHSSFAVTQRYIGIAQDELDDAYTNLELA